ncbi:MAG TPA: DUF983 domain-containing protein [Chitinophagaceae bacterium]|nr:DUF983 domain-containing protein [Chitinophagaceae bacterium]
MAKPNYLLSLLQNKCPRCRKGKLFAGRTSWKLSKNLKMHRNCPVCRQPTEIEVGFYYGTGYVSYALTVALSVASFVAWYILIGMSVDDSRFFYWLGFNALLLIVLQPYLMRLSRTIWLSFFVRYNPRWKEDPLNPEHLERSIPDQMEVVEKRP